LAPRFEQVKLLGLTAKLAMPHASLDALFTDKESIFTKPALLKYSLIFLQTAVGAIVSTIVTVDIHVELLPFTSTTVIVTVFEPMFAHVNVLGVTAKLAIPHASLDALFTARESIVRLPVLFRYLVMFLQIATGLMVSETVTVDVQIELLPFTSVTVNVTVFAPMFAHVNALGVTAKLAIPHASLDALFTAKESILA